MSKHSFANHLGNSYLEEISGRYLQRLTHRGRHQRWHWSAKEKIFLIVLITLIVLVHLANGVDGTYKIWQWLTREVLYTKGATWAIGTSYITATFGFIYMEILSKL